MASENTYWRDPALGEAHELDLPQGRLRVFEAGTGEPIVFVHGLLVNANLWRKVVARLAPGFRCVALDLPLGSHELPVPDADLSGPGLADIAAEAIEALGLERATVVGNDSGGAVSQMLVTRRPERIGRLVLTSCDAYDHYPPPLFRYLKPIARLPQGALPALFTPLRLRGPRRLPIAFGWLMHRPADRRAEDSYVLPFFASAAVRRDVQRVIGDGFKPEQTLAAAERFAEFERPVLIAWSRDDKVFRRESAERLARDFPNARLEWIDDSLAFSAEDQPQRLAELISGFVREPVTAGR